MKTSVKGILVLAVVVAVSFFASEKTEQSLPATQRLLSTYTTTSVRSDNVNKYCAANLDRTTLVSTSDYTEAQSMRATVDASMGISGYLFDDVEIP